MRFGNAYPVHQFTNWQSIQFLTYFGGSYSEGQVLVPAPGWIKAAHQNGVKIVGCVFFSPPPFSGNLEYGWLKQFTTEVNGHYPFADKLIAIAKAYGFDGYFINEETTESSAESQAFAKFFAYFHKKAPHLLLDWYQVPAFQPSATLLETKNKILSDHTFLDYSWQDNHNSNGWTNLAAKIHYPKLDLGFAIDASSEATVAMQQSTIRQVLNNGQPLGSISEFTLGNFGIANNHNTKLTTVDQNDADFWQGQTSGNWPGFESLTATYTAITQLPFSTDFNVGRGTQFFLQGKQVSKQSWSNMSLQGYLPTWGIRQTDSNLQGKYDYQNAFNGGDSFELTTKNSGNKQSQFKLFATHLKIHKKDQLEITYQANNSASFLTLSFKNHPTVNIALNSTNNHWKTISLSLRDYRQQLLTQISVTTNNSVAKNFQLLLGKIFIGKPRKLKPSKKIKIISQVINAAETQITLEWKQSKHAVYYNLYGKLNGEREFIAETYQPIYSLLDYKNHEYSGFQINPIL
jgi:endo-beta-N-acetylglucosaminidase D